MKVSVERCWTGGEKSYWRLSWVNPITGRGERERVDAHEWNRSAATLALNTLELHGIKRQNVRFDVR